VKSYEGLTTQEPGHLRAASACPIRPNDVPVRPSDLALVDCGGPGHQKRDACTGVTSIGSRTSPRAAVMN
jgi:hypothetical protein